MNEASRAQGWAICGGAALAALTFVIGVMKGAYWALAGPEVLSTDASTNPAAGGPATEDAA